MPADWENELFNQLIQSELSVAEIYFGFSARFPEDENLWLKLSTEEKAHASILRSGQQGFADEGLFPKEFMQISRELVTESLAYKQRLKDTIADESLQMSRRDAIEKAIDLEEGDIEQLFEKLMDVTPSDEAHRIFQSLNVATKNHAKRLRKHLAEIEE